MARIVLMALALLAATASAQLQQKACCIDHPNKPSSPANIANYDCSQLLPFGADRCNQVRRGDAGGCGLGGEKEEEGLPCRLFFVTWRILCNRRDNERGR